MCTRQTYLFHTLITFVHMHEGCQVLIVYIFFFKSLLRFLSFSSSFFFSFHIRPTMSRFHNSPSTSISISSHRENGRPAHVIIHKPSISHLIPFSIQSKKFLVAFTQKVHNDTHTILFKSSKQLNMQEYLIMHHSFSLLRPQ